jgi:hypothetical protein
VPQVPQLNATSFAQLTHRTDALVLYVAEACAACRALKATWLQLVASQAGGTEPLLVAAMLSPAHHGTPGGSLVTAFPTVLFLRDGACHPGAELAAHMRGGRAREL